MLPLSPPKGAQKRKKIKVCHKVTLCENCQRQSCRAFIGLTIDAKIIGGDVPFYLKFWVKLNALAGFRLILTSMTLNDLERRNSSYFEFFTEFDCVADQIRHSG